MWIAWNNINDLGVKLTPADRSLSNLTQAKMFTDKVIKKNILTYVKFSLFHRLCYPWGSDGQPNEMHC